MNPTKAKIVQVARDLFSERGYDEVTLRDIASACDISPGNLSYHFKKKEELISVIFEDVYTSFYRDLCTSTENSLAGLLDRFRVYDENTRAHPYFFRNIAEVANLLESGRGLRIREQNHFYYLRTFDVLTREGIFREDLPEGHYPNLALHLLMIQFVWYAQNSPSYEQAFSDFTFFESLCDSVYPYLTDRGIEDWNAYFDSERTETA